MKNNVLIEKIYSKRSIKRVETKITLLGVNSKLDEISFLNIRLLFSVLIFSFTLFISSIGYIYAPIVTAIFYYGIEYIFIDIKIKERRKKLDKESILFFQILALSLETGRNLKSAFELATKNIDSDLSDEFKYMLNEIKYGKSIKEALKNTKERVPSESINNVILNISESSVLGSSIIDTLYSQVEYLREKEFLEIKGRINKMPMKISIVSVIFFVPIMLLLVLGPLLIEYLL